jgi:hypothetical protein
MSLQKRKQLTSSSCLRNSQDGHVIVIAISDTLPAAFVLLQGEVSIRYGGEMREIQVMRAGEAVAVVGCILRHRYLGSLPTSWQYDLAKLLMEHDKPGMYILHVCEVHMPVM